MNDFDAVFDLTESNHEALNADPERIAVGGDSAGDTLSAAISIRRQPQCKTFPIEELAEGFFWAAAKARTAKRSLCRYLMVKTTAAHLSLRQPKSTLANRTSPGQPITTDPDYV